MKKAIIILVCFALLVPFCGMLSYAVPFTQSIKPETVEALRFPEDEPIFTDTSNRVLQFFSSPYGTFQFADALNSAQKAVYDSIIEQEAGLFNNGTVNVFIPVSEDYKLTLQAVISAAIDDYPEFFWLGGFGISGKKTVNGYELTLQFTLDTSSYANWDAVKESYYELLSAVESFEVKGNTRYAKLKSIHDSICKMTVYTVGVPMAHQPTGVFLKGTAVCEGYAEAFKLLCDRENIPCIIVVGTGNGGAHEWNYVQMEDGKWYGMDVTWDDKTSNDNNSKICYDYFLTGSESINAIFGKKKFGNGTDSDGDHINSGTHFTNSTYALTYPVISQQSYTGVIQMWNSEASFDNTRNFMFIPKAAVASEQILYTYTKYSLNAPSTNKVTVTGATTGGKVNITSPVSRTYTIVRKGDVNKSNTVDETDYYDVLDVVRCKKKVYTDKAQFAAADINGDGVIDAFDAIELDLYYRN